MAPSKAQTTDYLILGVGVGFRDPDDPNVADFALGGHVVKLGTDEAERLTALGAVREATEDEVSRAKALAAARASAIDLGPAENPYGGTPLISEEDHEAQERARAAAVQAPATPVASQTAAASAPAVVPAPSSPPAESSPPATAA